MRLSSALLNGVLMAVPVDAQELSPAGAITRSVKIPALYDEINNGAPDRTNRPQSACC